MSVGARFGLCTILIILEVVFVIPNPLEFLYLVKFREFVPRNVEDMERTYVSLMTFFIKHFCQCSLESFAKSSKDLGPF